MHPKWLKYDKQKWDRASAKAGSPLPSSSLWSLPAPASLGAADLTLNTLWEEPTSRQAGSAFPAAAVTKRCKLRLKLQGSEACSPVHGGAWACPAPSAGWEECVLQDLFSGPVAGDPTEPWPGLCLGLSWPWPLHLCLPSFNKDASHWVHVPLVLWYELIPSAAALCPSEVSFPGTGG